MEAEKKERRSKPSIPEDEEEEETLRKARELVLFREQLSMLDVIETWKAANEICEDMGHDSIDCKCLADEPLSPSEQQMRFRMVQPDGSIIGKLKSEDCYPVASIFVKNRAHKRKNRTLDRKKAAVLAASRSEDLESVQRRELKKKILKSLGIIRNKSGIGDKKINRESEMKRRVAETIVTTYCSSCEQNFSSSKMLLLHNEKVHDSKYLECHLCMDRFEQTIFFNRHMKTHYGPNAQHFVKCEFCDRKFKDREELTTHIDVTHRNEADNA